MVGAVVIVVLLLVVLPSMFLMLGMVLSAVVGWAAKSHAEEEHKDSELLDLNY